MLHDRGNFVNYQILLLPRTDYWSWVRASKDYVLRYGPNLTPDPVTAANYMPPRQVITFPVLPGGYPEYGDIERWLMDHHPGIRLDPIEVFAPGDFNNELERRIADKDRYGQTQRPFYLLWPSEYAVITQRFGANPQIYGRFGLPGHEGIDFRAKMNTNIYCSFPGEVYRVHTNPNSHAYGIHVRIRHRYSYKTIYGHLMKVLVGEGEKIEAGQLIGIADSTGASTGSHLHMSLKLNGATIRGETDYPKDIIDPSQYMVWPERALTKSFNSYGWSADKCLIGVNGRVRGQLQAMDLEAITEARLEAVKLDQKETNGTINQLRAINPAMFIMVRLTADFSRDPVSVEDFISHVQSDLERLYRLGIRYYEIHSSPNLQSEGWQRSWHGGGQFSNWFREVVDRLRDTYPEGKFGFPGLSPGEALTGWRGDLEQFLSDAEEAIFFADWVGVNSYWTDVSGMKALEGGRMYEEYRLHYPDKLLFVTEFCNPSAGVSNQAKGRQYLEFYRMLREIPGIGAAFAYTLSASNGHGAIVWRDEKNGRNPIPGIIGDRAIKS